MKQEIGQLDIPNGQLLDTGGQSKVSYSREIGEAQIVHTIFGKAKVRIVRKHDGFRRALWWMALAAVVLEVATWQGWLTPQPSGAAVQPVSVRAPEGVLPNKPDLIVQPPAIPVIASTPAAPAQTGITKPEIVPKSAPQPPQTFGTVASSPVRPLPRRMSVAASAVEASPVANTYTSPATSPVVVAPPATQQRREEAPAPVPATLSQPVTPTEQPPQPGK